MDACSQCKNTISGHTVACAAESYLLSAGERAGRLHIITFAGWVALALATGDLAMPLPSDKAVTAFPKRFLLSTGVLVVRRGVCAGAGCRFGSSCASGKW